MELSPILNHVVSIQGAPANYQPFDQLYRGAIYTPTAVNDDGSPPVIAVARPQIIIIS